MAAAKSAGDEWEQEKRGEGAQRSLLLWLGNLIESQQAAGKEETASIRESEGNRGISADSSDLEHIQRD